MATASRATIPAMTETIATLTSRFTAETTPEAPQGPTQPPAPGQGDGPDPEGPAPEPEPLPEGLPPTLPPDEDEKLGDRGNVR